MHDGASHLGAQLESLAGQSHGDWSLIVSDDGSRDDGPEMVRAFARAHPGRAITLIEGPRMGFARNFLHLLQAAGPDTPFAALCDQDDVWMPEKLAVGVASLSRAPAGEPALYCSRTLICDSDLRPLRPSPLWRRPPGFRNALVQNIVSGNTIILNRAALDLLQATAGRIPSIPYHDWWIYLMISGAQGNVIFDPEPRLFYRQHGNNAVSAGLGLRTNAMRPMRFLRGEFRRNSRFNIVALQQVRELLSEQSRNLLDGYARACDSPLSARMRDLRALGVYRQSLFSDMSFWVSAAMGNV